MPQLRVCLWGGQQLQRFGRHPLIRVPGTFQGQHFPWQVCLLGGASTSGFVRAGKRQLIYPWLGVSAFGGAKGTRTVLHSMSSFREGQSGQGGLLGHAGVALGLPWVTAGWFKKPLGVGLHSDISVSQKDWTQD